MSKIFQKFKKFHYFNTSIFFAKIFKILLKSL